MHSTIITQSEAETSDLARSVVPQVLAMAAQNAPVLISLQGDLGVGKSVFARSFIREFMADSSLNVPSPTFTLVQYYECGDTMLYHYDLYRLEDPEEIYNIGWEDSLSEGISLIEWPERLMGMNVPPILDISFEQIHNQTERKITLPGVLLP